MSILFFNPFFIFVLGLFIGSFLNSIIYRLENNLPFPLTYSFCPHCHHRLHSLDLIPVLSFLMLKGKCRYCGKKISFQYPIVEILTGFIFFFIFKFVSMNQLSVFDLIYYLIVSSFLIIIFVYDFKNFIIPDKYLFPLILTVFAYLLFQYFKFNNLNILLNSLIGALISLIFFLIIYLISSGKYLGFGDVKFSFFMGLFLGYPKILVALFFSFFIGAIIGIILIILKEKTFKSEIPFGPFLIIGVYIALFYGEEIINWYLSLAV